MNGLLHEGAQSGRCGRCEAPLRPGARFCAACGFDNASAGPAPHELVEPAPPDGGLSGPLTVYFVSLATLVLLVIASMDAGAAEALRLQTIFEWVLLAQAGVVAAIYHRRARLWFALPRNVTLRGVILTVGGAVGLALAMEALSAALPDLFMDEFEDYAHHGVGLASVLFSVAVMPAVAEEILFRGAVLDGLAGAFGNVRTAVIVSSLLFATIHLSPLSMLHLTLGGMGAAVLRLRTGSIYPAMGVHALYNGTLVMLWYAGR